MKQVLRKQGAAKARQVMQHAVTERNAKYCGALSCDAKKGCDAKGFKQCMAMTPKERAAAANARFQHLDLLNGYLADLPDEPNLMEGILGEFPEDATAANCGMGACTDDGCDDKAFMDCFKQMEPKAKLLHKNLEEHKLAQKKAVAPRAALGYHPYVLTATLAQRLMMAKAVEKNAQLCGAMSCKAKEGCDKSYFTECMSMTPEERVTLAKAKFMSMNLLEGYLADMPDEPNVMEGILGQFPVDDTAANCGMGACDADGCDDQAFYTCFHQLETDTAKMQNEVKKTRGFQSLAARNGLRNMQRFEQLNLMEGYLADLPDEPNLMEGELAQYPVDTNLEGPLGQYPIDTNLEGYLSQYPVDTNLEGPLAQYPIDTNLEGPLGQYPIDTNLEGYLAQYPVDTNLEGPLAQYPIDTNLEGPLGQYPIDTNLEGPLGQYPIDTNLEGPLGQYPIDTNLEGPLGQYPIDTNLEGPLGQFPIDTNLEGPLGQFPIDDNLEGPLGQYPVSENLVGYLGDFPEDTTAATCGQGACDDNGCDDQAFINCLRQLRQVKNINKIRQGKHVKGVPHKAKKGTKAKEGKK